MLTLLLIACAAESTDTAQPAEEIFQPPDQPGDWLVGTEAFSFTSSAELETTVQVWFPASEASDTLYSYDSLVTYGALEDGVPDCASAHPVVLFSHGNTGIRYQSMFLAEWLAARGYIVVAPDHVYNTFFDQDGSKQDELVFRRPQDIADSFDWVVGASDEAGNLLEGCVEESAGYAITGHSFGGYTTMAVAEPAIDVAAMQTYCETNYGWLCDAAAWWYERNPGVDLAQVGDADRIWAAIPMAPAGYEVLAGTLDEVAVPTLVLGGGLDTLTPMDSAVTPIYDGLSVTPRYLGELVDADHYTFSDLCYLLPTRSECTSTQIDPDLAHGLINQAVTAHLDAARGFTEAADWLPVEDPEFLWTVGQ